MSIDELSGVGKAGLDPASLQETSTLKEGGKGAEFEKVRTDKLEKEEGLTGLSTEEIQFKENIMSRADIKQMENDFLHQAQSGGEGKELEVLTERINEVRGKVDNVRAQIPAVEKSAFSESITNYFSEAETRFNKMDSLMKEISSGDRQYSLQDLLKVQIQIQNISQNLEVLSKVVDKVTDGMKTMLRTQV